MASARIARNHSRPQIRQTRMLLTLDIGNSAVKVGLFDGERLTQVDSIAPPDAETIEEESHWREAFASLFGNTDIEHIGLVSVVPTRAEAVRSALRKTASVSITTVAPEMQLPFTLDYETPDTLGTDRLAAAAAGWVRFGRGESRSVLVVDAGTAVNYEVVHRNGIYRGGAIGAGPGLVRDALRAGTAQLPPVPLTLPEESVGQSTQTALRIGIMGGLVDGVRGMCDRLARSLPDSPHLVLTGGWSSLLVDHLAAATHHAPHLVLRGVRLLTIMNR